MSHLAWTRKILVRGGATVGTGFDEQPVASIHEDLLTSATQAFNSAVDTAYVAAFPGDADQAAVSAAWTSCYNAMATGLSLKS